MLGTRIDDPDGVESSAVSVPGLGLLDVTTRFDREKARHRVSGVVLSDDSAVSGYEIHMGQTELGPGLQAFSTLVRSRDSTNVHDGAVSSDGRVIGTYLHGLWDSLSYGSAMVARLRSRRSLPPLDESRWQSHRDSISDRYAALAGLLREHVDLSPIWRSLGFEPPG